MVGGGQVTPHRRNQVIARPAPARPGVLIAEDKDLEGWVAAFRPARCLALGWPKRSTGTGRRRSRYARDHAGSQGWTGPLGPLSRRSDCMIWNVVVLVNSSISAAASTPVYLAITGAAAASVTASRWPFTPAQTFTP